MRYTVVKSDGGIVTIHFDKPVDVIEYSRLRNPIEELEGIERILSVKRYSISLIVGLLFSNDELANSVARIVHEVIDKDNDDKLTREDIASLTEETAC